MCDVATGTKPPDAAGAGPHPAGRPLDPASPSLAPAGRADGAAELKFVVTERQAREVMAWARRHLAADLHADPLPGDAYLVNSLYLDTPALDVFHRTGLLGPRKYRLRRYGSEPTVWLELKRKRQGLVRKHRTAIPDAEVTTLLSGGPPGRSGHWFGNRVARHRLQPVCRITYRRFARIGRSESGTMRLTLDDEIRGQPANAWRVPDAPLRSPALLADGRVLELKFRGAMPALFRGLVMDFGLSPGSFSKYREAAADCVPLSRLFPADAAGAADA